MKYKISVLVGAIYYGILSTIVKLAYGEGFSLGVDEAVPSGTEQGLTKRDIPISYSFIVTLCRE